MTSVSQMSKTIVNVMVALKNNEGIARLLVNDVENPFAVAVSKEKKDAMIRPKNNESKILPIPFDTEATMEDGSFIRIYYNQGTMDSNETIMDANIFIDIIVANSLWLCNNGTDSTIRTYELLDRVIDVVGRRSVGKCPRLKIEGFDHVYINTQFNGIRIYCSNWSVETIPSEKR